ncbi:MAG: hypothetical protein WC473_00360 [Patescibacteria group bacterium]
MANEDSQSTAVAGTDPTLNLIDCLGMATPEALGCLVKVLCKGLQAIDGEVSKIIILLHGGKLDFKKIVRSIDGTIKSCDHGIDDTCRIINIVTKHVLDSQNNINGLTIKKWMEALCQNYFYCSDEFKLGLILSLLELAGSWDRRIPQDFNDGLDDILVHLVNNAQGISKHLLDEKYRGRLSNAIKRCFRCSDHSKVFTSVNIGDLSSRVREQFDYLAGTEILSLVILKEMNYAFFGSLNTEEATKLIKRGLATPEPTKPTV